MTISLVFCVRHLVDGINVIVYEFVADDVVPPVSSLVTTFSSAEGKVRGIC